MPSPLASPAPSPPASASASAVPPSPGAHVLAPTRHAHDVHDGGHNTGNSNVASPINNTISSSPPSSSLTSSTSSSIPSPPPFSPSTPHAPPFFINHYVIRQLEQVRNNADSITPRRSYRRFSLYSPTSSSSPPVCSSPPPSDESQSHMDALVPVDATHEHAAATSHAPTPTSHNDGSQSPTKRKKSMFKPSQKHMELINNRMKEKEKQQEKEKKHTRHKKDKEPNEDKSRETQPLTSSTLSTSISPSSSHSSSSSSSSSLSSPSPASSQQPAPTLHVHTDELQHQHNEHNNNSYVHTSMQTHDDSATHDDVVVSNDASSSSAAAASLDASSSSPQLLSDQASSETAAASLHSVQAKAVKALADEQRQQDDWALRFEHFRRVRSSALSPTSASSASASNPSSSPANVSSGDKSTNSDVGASPAPPAIVYMESQVSSLSFMDDLELLDDSQRSTPTQTPEPATNDTASTLAAHHYQTAHAEQPLITTPAAPTTSSSSSSSLPPLTPPPPLPFPRPHTASSSSAVSQLHLSPAGIAPWSDRDDNDESPDTAAIKSSMASSVSPVVIALPNKRDVPSLSDNRSPPLPRRELQPHSARRRATLGSMQILTPSQNASVASHSPSFNTYTPPYTALSSSVHIAPFPFTPTPPNFAQHALVTNSTLSTLSLPSAITSATAAAAPSPPQHSLVAPQLKSSQIVTLTPPLQPSPSISPKHAHLVAPSKQSTLHLPPLASASASASVAVSLSPPAQPQPPSSSPISSLLVPHPPVSPQPASPSLPSPAPSSPALSSAPSTVSLDLHSISSFSPSHHSYLSLSARSQSSVPSTLSLDSHSVNSQAYLSPSTRSQSSSKSASGSYTRFNRRRSGGNNSIRESDTIQPYNKPDRGELSNSQNDAQYNNNSSATNTVHAYNAPDTATVSAPPADAQLAVEQLKLAAAIAMQTEEIENSSLLFPTSKRVPIKKRRQNSNLDALKWMVDGAVFALSPDALPQAIHSPSSPSVSPPTLSAAIPPLSPSGLVSPSRSGASSASVSRRRTLESFAAISPMARQRNAVSPSKQQPTYRESRKTPTIKDVMSNTRMREESERYSSNELSHTLFQLCK